MGSRRFGGASVRADGAAVMGQRDSEAPAPTAAGRFVNGTGDGGGGAAPGGEASFDANMVLILAALFLALLFAIGLNSLARCALLCGGRHRGGGDAEGASPSSGRGATGGVKKRALRSIPVEVYGGGDEEAAEGEEDVCAICLGEFADGEKVRVLPRCRHGFHVRCVDAWLLSRGSCPTCRRPVMDGGGGEALSRRPESDTITVVVT